MSDDTVTIYLNEQGNLPPVIINVEDLTVSDLPVQFGRYKLQSILGEGGMARVFLAELQGPAGFRKKVALKVIRPKKGRVSTKETFDLIREACLAGRLKHPNLIDVYELGEADEQLFIAMELVEGLTLRKLIRSRSRIPPAVLLEISMCIARGLEKAHGRISKERPFGMVHCDLKPSNILISMEGEVKIGDFGVAIQRDFGTDLIFEPSGHVRGTPSYMSPEQVQGEALDGRSDLFSTGLLIAEMAMGGKPLPRRFVMKTLLAGEPLRAPLLTGNQFAQLEGVAAGLGEVVFNCLEPNRENRIFNAEALVAALSKLQRQIGFEPRLHRWLKESSQLVTESLALEPVHEVKKVDYARESTFNARANHSGPTLKYLSNIEPSLDHFVGRETELSELSTCFRKGARLVTLKGFGGAGKTRFSRHFARKMMYEWSGGVWFVELAERTTVLGVAHAIATVLDIPLSGQGNQQQLINHLGHRIAAIGPVLIVLDNFEQVIDHAPNTVGRLIALAPEAIFLVTSRESLKLSAEHIFELEPLPVKDSVELFKLRAETAGGLWPETEENNATIKRITKRLDGLPLAIELAAARTRMMSPPQLLERLSQRFKLLSGARRGAVPRQATLRALIDWSWDLLEPWEQSALAQISVFRDGFIMDAAEAVLDLSAWPDAPWSLDVVGSLLDKSLLRSRQVMGQPRFEMYVSIQEYATEKLNGVVDSNRSYSAQKTQHRHAEWFANLGNYITERVSGSGTHSQSSSELIGELENLVAGASTGNPKTAAQCSILAIRVLMLTGPVSLGANLASRTLQRPDLPRRLRMKLETSRSRCLRLAGSMAEARAMVSDLEPKKTRHVVKEEDLKSASGSTEGRERALLKAERIIELGKIEMAESNYAEAEQCYRKALAIFHNYGDRAGEGLAIGNLGACYRSQGQHDQAVEYYTHAIDIANEVGDKHIVGVHFGNLGVICQEKGQHDLAVEYFTQALDVAKKTGDKRQEGTHLGNLGGVYLEKGQHDQAVDHLIQSVEIAREMGSKRSEGVNLGNLGGIYQLQGQHDLAVEHFTEAIHIAREVGNKRNEGVNLGNLGDTFAKMAQYDKAEDAFQKSIPICDETFPLAAGAFRAYLAFIFAQQGKIDEAQELLVAGEPQVTSYPLELAKFLCRQGQVHSLAGKSKAANKSLEQAKALSTKHRLENDAELSQVISELTDLLGSLDETVGEGRELGLLEAERLMELGKIDAAESKYPEAERCYLSALEIYEKHGDRTGEGEAIGCLGNAYKDQGKHDRAIEYYNQAIDIAREIGDKRNESSHLGNLGVVYRKLGLYGSAVEHYNQAIDIAKDIGNKRNEGIQLGNLGDTFVKIGRLEEAEEAFLKAIPICDLAFSVAAGAFRGSLALLLAKKDQIDKAQDLLELGEPQVTTYPLEHVKILCKKGQVQIMAGKSRAAQEALEKAKKLSDEHQFGEDGEVAEAIRELDETLTEPRKPDEERDIELLEAERLMELGNIEGAESKYIEAERCYMNAIEIFQKHGVRTGEGGAISKLGAIYERKGELVQAVEHFRQAIEIAREIGDKSIEASTLCTLGNVYLHKGELDWAVTYYTQSIDIFREIGNKASEGITLGNLGTVYINKGEQDRARELYTNSLDIAREVGHRASEGVSLGNLGTVYKNRGEYDLSAEHFNQAIEIAREIGHKYSEGVNLGNLGDVFSRQGRLEAAEDAFRKAISISDVACPPAAGAFGVSLALLLARKGLHDEAQGLLENGELLVTPIPEEHAKFLGKKGQVQLLAGEAKLAKESLDQAKKLATKHKLGDDAEVARAINELTALLESSSVTK